jgi:hypothetical protein
MADQAGAAASGGSFKVFLAGLVTGIVVGALGAAFLVPILVNEPPPVQPVKQVNTADLPPGFRETTDERGLRTPPSEPAPAPTGDPAAPKDSPASGSPSAEPTKPGG